MPSSDSLSIKENFNLEKNFNPEENFNKMIKRQKSRVFLIRTSVVFPHLRPMEKELLIREMENLIDEHEALRRTEDEHL